MGCVLSLFGFVLNEHKSEVYGFTHFSNTNTTQMPSLVLRRPPCLSCKPLLGSSRELASDSASSSTLAGRMLLFLNWSRIWD